MSILASLPFAPSFLLDRSLLGDAEGALLVILLRMDGRVGMGSVVEVAEVAEVTEVQVLHSSPGQKGQ